MYHYNKLNYKSKQIYNIILKALQEHRSKIHIKERVDNHLNIKNIVTAINLDNPLLFYVDFRTFSMRLSSTQTTLIFRYLHTEGQIENNISELQNTINKFEKVKRLCLIEKEITIHNALAKRIVYNNYPKKYDEYHTVVGALIYKKAACDGYSKAFKVICDYCEIPCIVITGKLKKENNQWESHAWNMVKINNAWHHVDLTCDEVMDFSKKIVLCDYFNIGDSEISRTHKWNTTYYPPGITGAFEFRCQTDNYADIEKYIISRIQNNMQTLRLKFSSSTNKHNLDYLRLTSKILTKNNINFTKIEGCYNETLEFATIHVTI